MQGNRLKGMRAAMSAGAVLMLAAGAMAQTPSPAPSAPRTGNGLDRIGVIDRPLILKQVGLDEQAVGLTSEQKSQVDQIVDTFLAEDKALHEKYPVTPGVAPTPEALAARLAARKKMSNALRKVLTADQRKAWQAALATRQQTSRPPNAQLSR